MNTCTNSGASGDVDEFDISGLEAMLAGTLCLMSAYSHCNCDNKTNQGLIGMKIVSNLSYLQYQNTLSPEFRRVLGKVCDSWRQHSLPPSPAQNRQSNPALPPLWHAEPNVMQ